MKKERTRVSHLVYLIIAFLFFGFVGWMLINSNSSNADELTTTEFLAAVNEDRAIEVNYNASTGEVKGKYRKEGSTAASRPVEFKSTYVGEESINELIAAHPNISFTVKVNVNSFWVNLLATFIPLLLILAVFWVFMSQMSGTNSKQMQFGKTKAKKTAEERPKVKFSDVAGIDEAVEELEEIKEFLASPQKFQKMGAKIPRGVLLVGPPGTGKTLLAKAVAGEAGVPFFSISGSDFVEMFVGVGASRVRDLFDQAKNAAPSIIFIDEIDAVGRQRGTGLGGGHDEREQTLNQLLVEMDGFDDHQSVILIAATNRADILDPALLRPGRFDRQIVVDRPDLKGRAQILKVHSKGKPLASNIDLETIAQLTPGFTGADLANLMNEAALLAARRKKTTITSAEIDEAIERVIAGPERKSRIITDKERKIIAYHESGHALVGHLLEHADPVHKISIIARGQALGYTLSLPEEDHFLTTKSEMLDDLAVFMGGRVAEEIACGDITTGASNDLERASKLAKNMVTRYGMSDSLGAQVYGEAHHEVFLGRDYGATPDYSEETAHRIDVEVANIIRDAHDVAYKILSENREQLDLMASVLLERETVDGEAVKALLDNKWDEYLEHEDEILENKKKQDAIVEDEKVPVLHVPPRERKAREAKQLKEETKSEASPFDPFDVPLDGKPLSPEELLSGDFGEYETPDDDDDEAEYTEEETIIEDETIDEDQD